MENDPVIRKLLAIRGRPAMYIGKCSIHNLYVYLLGYVESLYDNDVLTFHGSEFHKFVEYLVRKYGRGGGGNSWAWVLAKKTGSSKDAVELFYEELLLYINNIS